MSIDLAHGIANATLQEVVRLKALHPCDVLLGSLKPCQICSSSAGAQLHTLECHGQESSDMIFSAGTQAGKSRRWQDDTGI